MKKKCLYNIYYETFDDFKTGINDCLACVETDYKTLKKNVIGVAEYNNGSACPAERLNKKRYAENWLENLLIAASLHGTKNIPKM